MFHALTTKEIVDWWVRPGVFDTKKWSGDVRVGGRWRASGHAHGQPYVLEGEFLEVDPPRKLVHTWQRAGAPGQPTIVTYLLEALDGGTRITLRHEGPSRASRARGPASVGRRASSILRNLFPVSTPPASAPRHKRRHHRTRRGRWSPSRILGRLPLERRARLAPMLVVADGLGSASRLRMIREH